MSQIATFWAKYVGVWSVFKKLLSLPLAVSPKWQWPIWDNGTKLEHLTISVPHCSILIVGCNLGHTTCLPCFSFKQVIFNKNPHVSFFPYRWETMAPSSPRPSPGTHTPPRSTALDPRAWRWAMARGPRPCRPAWVPAASPVWACTRWTGPRRRRSRCWLGERVNSTYILIYYQWCCDMRWCKMCYTVKYKLCSKSVSLNIIKFLAAPSSGRMLNWFSSSTMYTTSSLTA